MSDISPTASKIKSFWEKPEGKTGKAFLWLLGGGLVVAAVKFLSWWLPILIGVLQNAVQAVALGVTLFVMIYLITNKRFQALAGYMFQSLMRLITSFWIEIDPIGIMKGYVADLKKKYQNIEIQMSKLKGQMTELRERIEENKRIREESLRYAKEARRRMDKGEQSMRASFTLYSRKAKRKADSNITYEQMLVKLEFLYRILEKMKAASLYYIEDITDQVEELTIKRKQINSAYSAYKSAMGIIKDGTEKRAIFDQTVEYLKSDYGQKLGEIESFIDLSAGFIDAVDLENGMMEQEALDQLEEWERKADDLILGPADKSVLASQAAADDDVLDLNAERSVDVPDQVRTSKDKYRRLLGDQ